MYGVCGTAVEDRVSARQPDTHQTQEAALRGVKISSLQTLHKDIAGGALEWTLRSQRREGLV